MQKASETVSCRHDSHDANSHEPVLACRRRLTFPLGYSWHLVVFDKHYRALDLYRSDVIIPLGLTAMLVQGLIFAWIYPRLFNTRRAAWFSSATQFFGLFSVLAWSFTTLPVAAKYEMASVSQFMLLETGFTVLQFLVVSPLIALAWRDRRDNGNAAP